MTALPLGLPLRIAVAFESIGVLAAPRHADGSILSASTVPEIAALRQKHIR